MRNIILITCNVSHDKIDGMGIAVSRKDHMDMGHKDIELIEKAQIQLRKYYDRAFKKISKHETIKTKIFKKIKTEISNKIKLDKIKLDKKFYNMKFYNMGV